MINRLLKQFIVPAILMAGVLLTSNSVLAQSKSLGGNSHVQLKPIMTPTQPPPGSFLGRTYPLTPVMTVPKAKDVSFICRRAPRAAEAILQYFQRNPVPLVQGRGVDLESINKNSTQIAIYVNRALGRNAVSEVYFTDVVAGSMARGSMARLPFVKIQGCSRVLKEYEERVKKLEGE